MYKDSDSHLQQETRKLGRGLARNPEPAAPCRRPRPRRGVSTARPRSLQSAPPGRQPPDGNDDREGHSVEQERFELGPRPRKATQIGRAAGMARVCMYVKI